eukprot:CAMPEP_0180648530 /NCGR_PEP_ID=MMETSP1037_2-20121125/51026_1 /TAXON_ID=632150 /ORGANISM="Azadinium spinosum, Strain 3D9" /LENGTH=138 /DNA_ID=CAMNT_0022673369 /DNA_START=72 /DNA_END=485 /DNA_ORIENTATION=+
MCSASVSEEGLVREFARRDPSATRTAEDSVASTVHRPHIRVREVRVPISPAWVRQAGDISGLFAINLGPSDLGALLTASAGGAPGAFAFASSFLGGGWKALLSLPLAATPPEASSPERDSPPPSGRLGRGGARWSCCR